MTTTEPTCFPVEPVCDCGHNADEHSIKGPCSRCKDPPCRPAHPVLARDRAPHKADRRCRPGGVLLDGPRPSRLSRLGLQPADPGRPRGYQLRMLAEGHVRLGRKHRLPGQTGPPPARDGLREGIHLRDAGRLYPVPPGPLPRRIRYSARQGIPDAPRPHPVQTAH